VLSVEQRTASSPPNNIDIMVLILKGQGETFRLSFVIKEERGKLWKILQEIKIETYREIRDTGRGSERSF
jgi:hypothetical protein